jgi:hypothetical protein
MHVDLRRNALFRPAAVILVLVATCFMYLNLFVLPYTPRFIPEDQFIYFGGARRMLAGQSIYVDFFQYTLPGTELLFFCLMKIVGLKLWLPNVVVMVVALASVWLGFILASAILPESEALLACLLFLCLGWYHTPDATHHKFSIVLVYAAAAMLIRRRNTSRLIAAGALCGLAAFFTQTRALAVITIGGFLVWENISRGGNRRSLLRKEAALLIPFAAVLAPACAYFASKLGVNRFIELTVGFPLFHYREDRVHNAWSALAGDFSKLRLDSMVYSVAMHALIPAVYGVFLIYYWRFASRHSKEWWARPILIASIGLVLFATIGYAPIWMRLCEISLPAFILLIWLMEESPRLQALRTPMWSVAIFLVVAMPAYLQTRWRGYLDSPIGRAVMFDRGDHDEYSWMLLHTTPGEYLFWPASSAPYYLSDTVDPVSLPFLTPSGYTTLDEVPTTIRELERHPPRLIFWTADLNDRRFEADDHLEPIRTYVAGHYHVIKSFPVGDQVWQRSPVATAAQK